MENPQLSLLAKNATRCCNREKNMYKRFLVPASARSGTRTCVVSIRGRYIALAAIPVGQVALILETLVDRHIPNLKILMQRGIKATRRFGHYYVSFLLSFHFLPAGWTLVTDKSSTYKTTETIGIVLDNSD